MPDRPRRDVLDRRLADLNRRLAGMAELRDDLVDLRVRRARLPSDARCHCGLIEHRR